MINNPAYDLTLLEHEAERNEAENDSFKIYLTTLDGQQVDETVHRLNDSVSSIVDCTSCGNCCRSLMINVRQEESENLSRHLDMPLTEFKNNYLEESQQGALVINTIPCHFLFENRCSVYENRFTECREFPHLHKPHFTGRLFGTFMHYGRCPIVFNVIEQLKDELGFHELK